MPLLYLFLLTSPPPPERAKGNIQRMFAVLGRNNPANLACHSLILALSLDASWNTKKGFKQRKRAQTKECPEHHASSCHLRWNRIPCCCPLFLRLLPSTGGARGKLQKKQTQAMVVSTGDQFFGCRDKFAFVCGQITTPCWTPQGPEKVVSRKKNNISPSFILTTSRFWITVLTQPTALGPAQIGLHAPIQFYQSLAWKTPWVILDLRLCWINTRQPIAQHTVLFRKKTWLLYVSSPHNG